MPSCYTAPVNDGSVTDLKTFIMGLARGMGALVTMRDAPHGAEIPERFEPTNYHLNRMEEAKAERERIIKLTPEQVAEAINAEVVEHGISKTKAFANHTLIRQRYQAMLEKVEGWEGAPEGIKEFAISQLSEIMNFDCREPFKFYGQEPITDPALWMSRNLEMLDDEIAHQTKQHEAEVARTEERNAWLAQLRASLEGQ